MFDNNFGKCGPSIKILSPADSRENSLCNAQRLPPHVRYVATLWKLKIKKCCWFWQHPQQTVGMFLRTLWSLNLTFENMLTDCLKTADIKWLTNILKFVSRRLESIVERCSVERCCIMVIFFHHDCLHTVFILSRLYVLRCTHIKSIVQYFCDTLHKISH